MRPTSEGREVRRTFDRRGERRIEEKKCPCGKAGNRRLRRAGPEMASQT